MDGKGRDNQQERCNAKRKKTLKKNAYAQFHPKKSLI